MRHETTTWWLSFTGTLLRYYLSVAIVIVTFSDWGALVASPIAATVALFTGAALGALGVDLSFRVTADREIRYLFTSWGRIEQPIMYATIGPIGLMPIAMRLGTSPEQFAYLAAWMFPAGVLYGFSAVISAENEKDGNRDRRTRS